MNAKRLTPAQWLAAYAVTLAVMGVLDGGWLGWLMLDFYKRELGALMTDAVRVVPAALYYLLFPIAVVYLAASPSRSSGEAALRGAVLGLAAFGVYDLTNLATLRGYSVTMTLVDIAWGGFATLLGSLAAYHFVVARSTAA
ncbi:MAG: DUF2177 family protein [Caldimonas sp.]